jgi:hypothetical protein
MNLAGVPTIQSFFRSSRSKNCNDIQPQDPPNDDENHQDIQPCPHDEELMQSDGVNTAES